MPEPKTTLYCTFCGKSQHEVRKLIAGPTVFICDECVLLCMEIMEKDGTVPGKRNDGFFMLSNADIDMLRRRKMTAQKLMDRTCPEGIPRNLSAAQLFVSIATDLKKDYGISTMDDRVRLTLFREWLMGQRSGVDSEINEVDRELAEVNAKTPRDVTVQTQAAESPFADSQKPPEPSKPSCDN